MKEVNIGEIEKEIRKLDKSKAPQKTDIPTRIIKENIDVTAEFLCTNINSAIKSRSFLSSSLPYSILPYCNVGNVEEICR